MVIRSLSRCAPLFEYKKGAVYRHAQGVRDFKSSDLGPAMPGGFLWTYALTTYLQYTDIRSANSSGKS